LILVNFLPKKIPNLNDLGSVKNNKSINGYDRDQ